MDESRRPASKKLPSTATSTPDIEKRPSNSTRTWTNNKSGTSSKGRSIISPAATETAAAAAAAVASPPPSTQPIVTQQHNAWAASRNPITGRNTNTQRTDHKNAVARQPASSLREGGQKTRPIPKSSIETPDSYVEKSSDLKMAQQKKPAGEHPNGTAKGGQVNMPFHKKDQARTGGNNANRMDNKGSNGNRSNFRTDTDISNGRTFGGRELQPWQPDADSSIPDGLDGGLESSHKQGKWDQFAANERLFGVKSNYDEHFYTTRIDTQHPKHRQRVLDAEKKAREIEGSIPAHAHVAEERVMDFMGSNGNDGDEEDKYSGVRRQDTLSSGRDNRYMPPARRAPTGQATVAGAPVDPAIISAQLKGGPARKPQAKNGDSKIATLTAASSTQQTGQVSQAKTTDSDPQSTGDKKAAPPPDSGSKSLRPSATNTRTASPQGQDQANSRAATQTVEKDVLKAFKGFAMQQRNIDTQRRNLKMRQDSQVKLQELKNFAHNFKLSTPIPPDLISIMFKDPSRQKELQQQALANASEPAAKTKEPQALSKSKEPLPKDAVSIPATEAPVTGAVAGASVSDGRSHSRPVAGSGLPQQTPPASGVSNRHSGQRQSYAPGGYHQNFRNDRSSAAPRGGGQPTGHLSERLRQAEKERFPRGQQQYAPDMRAAPVPGPTPNMDPNMGRRMNHGAAPGHMAAKLNPNSHEFRPSPFAATFSPTGPSAASSPRSTMNPIEAQPAPSQAGQLIRRKVKSLDVKKCNILAQISTLTPPAGRNWDENGGMRPAYDTPPVWKPVQDDEQDSLIVQTYKEYFQRLPYTGNTSMPTPNPQHAYPQGLNHQHQMPMALQQGSHNIPRQSPHMPPMQMHPGQHGHVPHVSFSHADDHRMMQSHSSQSYASPRMANQVPMYAPNMNSPAPGMYSQPAVPQQYMPGTPQMNQYRHYPNGPQYMSQQAGPGAMPIMPPQQQFVGPNSVMPGGPQMPVYQGGHPQFLGHGTAPPQQQQQQMAGTAGFPSPGRPAAAPMMAQQGSQQGQPMYAMSPAMQYQQPSFAPQHAGQMSGRGYSNPGSQHYGTSPQQTTHHYGHHQRNGNNNHYGNKGYHNQHHHHSGPATAAAGAQSRAADGEEGK